MTEEERIPHVIYGYRCKVGHMAGKWKIGCTMQRRKEIRHDAHQKAKSACRLFDRYLRARMREGYSFADVFEYFQLRVFVCTRRDAERWEDIYTDRYKAMTPNGFNLMSGSYNGQQSEETKSLMSKNRKGKGIGKIGGKENWSAERLERLERRKERNEIRRWIRKAKSKKLPKMDRTKIVEFIVISAGIPLKERG